MGLYLNSGNDGFAISVYDDIYIDKTNLIDFTNSRVGKRKRYLCISRPRRFGIEYTAAIKRSTKNLVPYIQTEVIKELKEAYEQYVPENETRLSKVIEKVKNENKEK